MAVLQQRLNAKAEGAEVDDLRRLLSALKTQVQALQASAEAAAPNQAPLRSASAFNAARKSSSRLSAVRAASFLAAPMTPAGRRESSVMATLPPPAQLGADAVAAKGAGTQAQQPDQAAWTATSVHRISLASYVTDLGSLSATDPADLHVVEGADTEGMPRLPQQLPLAAVLAPAPSSAAHTTADAADTLARDAIGASAAAVREELAAMQQGMQAALQALDQGLAGLQDEVDDLALRAEADRKLVATLESRVLHVQEQQLSQLSAAGHLPLTSHEGMSDSAAWPIGSLHAASQGNEHAAEASQAVSSNMRGISPAYGKQWPGARDAADAQQSMRSVRRALAVITNASHIMAVGTPLQPSPEVDILACKMSSSCKAQ
jgi:hypothetical protein